MPGQVLKKDAIVIVQAVLPERPGAPGLGSQA